MSSTSTPKQEKLVVIDTHALIHRAFHALPPLTSARGEPVGALYGVSNFLLKMLREIKPDYITACFDRPEPTFRHEAYDDYKATRKKSPDELIAQIITTHELVEQFGIPIFEFPGFEADDVIATITKQLKKKDGLQVIIVSGDLDTLQLVDEERVVVYVPKRGISETMVYDERAVEARFGIKPDQLADFKGLKGDPSDNIPGVPGVGDKTASKLIQKFGSIEKMYDEISKVDTKSLKKTEQTLYEKLLNHEKGARFSKELATLRYDVPVDLKLKDVSYGGIPKEKLGEYFKKMGFNSMLARLSGGVRSPGATTTPSVSSGAGRSTTSSLTEKSRPGVGQAYIVPVHNEDEEKEMLELISKAGRKIVEKKNIAKALGPILDSVREIVGFDLKDVARALSAGGYSHTGKWHDFQVGGWLLSSEDKEQNIDALQKKFTISQIYNWQKKKLVDLKLWKIFDTIEMPLLSILADMEFLGIRVNVAHLEELNKRITEEISKLEKQVYAATAHEFNINSPKQTADMLFNVLELPTKGIKKTPGGALSTDAHELEKLKDIHPCIKLILSYRELFKLKSTYIDALPEYVQKKSGRLHTTFNQTGTVTGRLSSENPNLQNIPAQQEVYADEIRAAFVVEDGYTLCSFDYSQIELRVAASLSGDKKMIETFMRGDDIHRITAAQVHGVAPEAVDDAMRRSAKALNFGIIYGMGVDAFARNSGLTRAQAKDFITKYFENFPAIKEYHNTVIEFGREHGYVLNELGRRRWLKDLRSGHPRYRASAERMAINFPLQSLDADIMKLAMIALKNEFVKMGVWNQDVRMLIQIHDQLLFEIRDDILEESTTKIKNIMEEVYSLKVPTCVDVKVGPHWGDLKNVRL